MGRLDGLGIHRHVVEGPELALVIKRLGCRPGLGQHMHGFLETLVGLGHREVQAVKLTPLIATADAQVQAAVTEQIDCRGLLGQLDGIVKRQNRHRGGQPDGVRETRQVS